MKAFAAFFLFLTLFLVFGRVLRDDFSPDLPVGWLVLIATLAAAVLVWIWQRSTEAAASVEAPPTLEDLERALAATSDLVWEAAPDASVAKEKSAAKAESTPTSSEKSGL